MLIDSVVHMTIKWPFWKLLGLCIAGIFIQVYLDLTYGITIENDTFCVMYGLWIMFLPFYGIYRFNKYFQVTQTLFGDD